MSRRKSLEEVRSIVWRLRLSDPAGIGVDGTDLPSDLQALLDAVEAMDRGWQVSSRELREGLRVSEAPMDTLPGELIDVFMKSKN